MPSWACRRRARRTRIPSEGAAVATKPVVVFAAASLKNALDLVAKAWETKAGGKATFSFAASSAIAKQIESGAPADVFISADLKWMDWLAERKLIDPASRKTLLGNTLVLIARKDSTSELKIEKGFDLAAALGDGRLAMGDPKSVPAGTYGEAALTNLGVWDQVSPKIAGAENVRVALSYVARGETPLGIVYGTDAKREPQVKVVDTFPIRQPPADRLPGGPHRRLDERRGQGVSRLPLLARRRQGVRGRRLHRPEIAQNPLARSLRFRHRHAPPRLSRHGEAMRFA